MPIMNDVERKSTIGRFALVIIYILVVFGSITTLYPFALMIAGSISSGVDAESYELLPRYLRDDDMLLVKYAETRYCEKVLRDPTRHLNRQWLTGVTSFATMTEELLPVLRRERQAPTLAQRAGDWRQFSDTVPLTARIRCLDGLMTQDFRVDLLRRFGGRDGIRQQLSIHYDAVMLPFEDPYRRGWVEPQTPLYREYREFLRNYDPDYWSVPVLFDGEFSLFLRSKHPTIAAVNNALGTNYESFADIRLTAQPPVGRLRSEWLAFVRDRLPLRHIRLNCRPGDYRAFAASRMGGGIDKYNSLIGTSYDDFDQIPVPRTVPTTATAVGLWTQFLAKTTRADDLGVETNDTRFRQHVRAQYGRIEALNDAWGTDYETFAEVRPQQLAADLTTFAGETTRWRWHFIVNNYLVVWRYIALNGRALWNTLILCFFTVLAQLTVNPMCAYALSRFQPRYTYKVLMYLIATMAFPSMVLMIPNFILMKQLHMLNTYYALIIPTMASGYFIFLMKGFFDSLPPELYEAARIDGASEFDMFVRITLPLVKPIMAVQALGAFTAAYGGFMWAFIICQDPKMWTIMVYVYQFQQQEPYHLVMAALAVSSIPLLLMFIFCQRLIMRGIVIPVMK